MTILIVCCIWFDLCLLCSSLIFSKYIWTTHGQPWRPYQHQCPIVLVHEAKRMQQLVHGHNQARGEAARVQVKQLLPSLHTWTPLLGISLVAWLTFGLSGPDSVWYIFCTIVHSNDFCDIQKGRLKKRQTNLDKDWRNGYYQRFSTNVRDSLIRQDKYKLQILF